MENYVRASIPVSPEAAELLGDPQRARSVGQLVSDLLHPTRPESDPLAGLLRALKEEARVSGLTDADIDSELAVYNAERRS